MKRQDLRKDLRSQIIPTKIGNTDGNQKTGNKKFDTIDLVYLASYDELFKGNRTDEERRVSTTDYAKMNNSDTLSSYGLLTKKASSLMWLRPACSRYHVNCAYGSDRWDVRLTHNRSAGLCPSLHYNLPFNISARSALRFSNKGKTKTQEEELNLDIREVKDKKGKVLYHTLQIGAYPRTKEDEQSSIILESLYNGGKIKEGLVSIGLWYSINGQKENCKNYAGKHSPVFEYKDELHVRVVSTPNDSSIEYSDGTISGRSGTVRWTKLEPISFIIKNWDEMPKHINTKGNGKAKYFDLIAEEVIISNIPFYPNANDLNSTMWQNSMPRGFLNGIDVRNITENGNPEFGAERGGDFTGECSFLNEAFNLAREPIYEYAIPESETEIPDDAFNGCVSLKKLKLHYGITSIGERAFDGLNFKYVYRLKTGELVFGEEFPKEQEDIKAVIEIQKLAKHLIGFDYNILVQGNKLQEVINLSETLNKNKFSIPYVYRKGFNR